jgi:hypothetical protein
MCFFNSPKKTYFFFTNKHLPLENHDGQVLFLSKTYSILMGKQVLDASPSNSDVFLLRDACVSTIQLNRPFWKKVRVSLT